MAEGILFDNLVGNQEYDWTAAFNNSEFMDYINNIHYRGEYTGDEYEIPDYFYKNKKYMTKATFPYCYRRIGSHAFDGCLELSLVFFTSPSNYGVCYELGEEAFINCPSLEFVSMGLPRRIGKKAFYSLSKLNSFYCYSMAQAGTYSNYSWMWDIGEEAFKNDINISYFLSMSYADTIGKRAFENCRNIQEIDIGRLICRKVDDEAFKNCSNMKSIMLNTMIMGTPISECRLELGENIFEGCSSLSDLFITAPYTVTSTTLGNLRDSLTNARIDITGDLESIVSDMHIGSYAFISYSKLKSLFATYINNVEEYAFKDCITLSQCIIGCKKIGSHAFENCYELNNFMGPVRCSSVGEYAFANCSKLTNFTQATTSAEFIGKRAFFNCINLKLLNIAGVSSVPILEDVNAFENVHSEFKIAVPSSLYYSFIEDSKWGLLSEYIVK